MNVRTYYKSERTGEPVLLFYNQILNAMKTRNFIRLLRNAVLLSALALSSFTTLAQLPIGGPGPAIAVSRGNNPNPVPINQAPPQGPGPAITPAPAPAPGPGPAVAPPPAPAAWGSPWWQGWNPSPSVVMSPSVTVPNLNSGAMKVIANGYDAMGVWRVLPLFVRYNFNGINYNVTVLNAWDPWTDMWNRGVDVQAFSTDYTLRGVNYDYYVVLSFGTFYFNL